jgi:asparagine synthase (glutamine-hydrolysing)
MQYLDLKHRLPDAVVLGLDRMSMAHSVEARVPFLDHELVEFCARIPPRCKMKRLREKHILRRAMEGVLPDEIRWRRKWPMQLPTRAWLNGDLPPYAEALLEPQALRAGGCFDPDGVRALRDRNRDGGSALWQVLASVLAVQVWIDVFRRSDAGAGAP